MNLASPKVPPLFILLFKLITIILISCSPMILYYIYRYFRYRWIKIPYKYFSQNGISIVHPTKFENVLKIESRRGFKLLSQLTWSHLFNCPNLLFTLKPKTGIWFFLNEPHSNQLMFNISGNKNLSIIIDIRKSKNILTSHDIY